MGTLFEQPPRSHCLENNSESRQAMKDSISYFMDRFDASFKDAVNAARLTNEYEWLQYKKIDLDIKDEQLAGFGNILHDISMSLSDIASKYRDN